MKKFTILLLAIYLHINCSNAQTLPSVEVVYKIFEAKCVSCHDNATPDGGLDLQGTGGSQNARAVNVASKLVNKNPSNAHALGKSDKLIYPGRPDRSFLFRKINSGFEPSIAALHASEGNEMPGYPSSGSLTEIEKELVRQWILYGAKSTGVLFDKALVEDWYNNNGLKSYPDGPPPAPAPEEGFQVKMGPFFLPPDGEVEYYQKYELKLPANVDVNRLDLKIPGYSHHLVLYNFNSTSGANTVSHGLRLNPNHSDISLVAAAQEQMTLNLPPTTAFKWNKDIILDLNAHFINYSIGHAFQCEAYVNVYTQPSGTADQQMYAALIPNLNLAIFNTGNTITSTAPVFQAGADSIYLWGIMGHTHKYGTSYKAWARLPNGQKGDMIYDAACPQGIPGCAAPYYDYRHIPIRYWEPLHPLMWGQGIVHEATWVNDGPGNVFFGPTSDDEMMVLILFYTQNPLILDANEPIDKGFLTPEVMVSPNPANEQVNISTISVKGAQSLRVYDREGKVVINKAMNGERNFTLDVSALPSGIYFYNLDGNVGKVVVER